MNTLTKTFENSDIRVAKIDNQFWWNLKDVCIALGMATGSEKKLKKRHGANHFQLVSFRHPLNAKSWGMTAVNQKGLLRIIWRSNMPKAEIFSDWCADVISEILETGRYDVAEHKEQMEQLRFDLINSEQELVQTQEALEEANAEVNRRAFLVIKAAVEEWRLQNGYKNTDYDWRSSHLGECCAALRRIGYTKGSTLYVHAEYMENAHLAIKHIYDTHQRNPPSVCVPLNQLTLYSFLPIV